MPKTPAGADECSITVGPPTAHAGAAGDEVQPSESSADQPRTQELVKELDQGCSTGSPGCSFATGADRARRKKLKKLNNIVFGVAFLEWAGNTIGTVAFIWATVVLLGGFCSLLNYMDFWFSAIMIFIEGSRVFIRNDASINLWLFGSTRAFRWDDFSLPRMSVRPGVLNIMAVLIGVYFAFIPEFRPEIVAGTLKVALLVIISQLLTRLSNRWFAQIIIGFAIVFTFASFCGLMIIGNPLHTTNAAVAFMKIFLIYFKFMGTIFVVALGATILTRLSWLIMSCIPFLRRPRPLVCLKLVTALGLACWPILQPILTSNYKYFSIAFTIVLLTLSDSYEIKKTLSNLEPREQGNSSSETLPNNNSSLETSEKNNHSSDTCGQNKSLLLQIIETVLPTLFFWSVMFPLPGLSLKISFYMLISAIAAVLVGNLQVPVAFLQVLLSAMRLSSLLGHHKHDYHPLPHDASPNLVPSIVVFFMLELCQGSSYILAVVLGFYSFIRRRSLVRDFKFKEKWGLQAVNLYYRQAYQARTEKGLLGSEKEKYTPSLESFAVQSLGGTSNYEMQILGLRILDSYLQEDDSKSKRKLITEIVKDAKNIITNITGLICYLTEEEDSGDTHEHCTKFLTRLTGETIDDIKKKQKTEQKEVISLCLEFVIRLAANGRKICARFRKELSENAFFLDSLERILDLEEVQPELREAVMHIIAGLALDEAARKEIGSTESIIPKLTEAVLMPEYNSLRMAAGEALANLTTNSTDNCRAILLPDPEHNLIKNLVSMLEDEHRRYVAAKLLHNLSANTNLWDISFGANMQPALEKAKQIVMTNKEGKQLESAVPGQAERNPINIGEVHGLPR